MKFEHSEIDNNGPIIICGCHGGGTSFITKILRYNGIFTGNKSGKKEDRKFHESLIFKSINKRIMKELINKDCAIWDKDIHKLLEILKHNKKYVKKLINSINSQKEYILEEYFGDIYDHQIWGWKDPRNSETLWLWKKIFPKCKILLIEKDINKNKNIHSHASKLFNKKMSNYAREFHFNPPFIDNDDNIYKIKFNKFIIDNKYFNKCMNWVGLRELNKQEHIKLLKDCNYESKEINIKPNKIDFIIVGAQKSATTVLNDYLNKHDDITMAIWKEIHFFDNNANFENNNINYNEYHKKFNGTIYTKIYGEATPSYIYIKKCPLRIYDYNNDIKLIMLLRNPIYRAFSHWNHEVQKGRENREFMECIEEEINDIRNNRHKEDLHKSYISRGIYTKQIKRYLKYFNKEQILFIKFNDFKNDNLKYLKKVFNFLNIKYGDYNYRKMVRHKREYYRDINSDEYDILKDFFRKDIKKLEQLLKWNCSDWLK